MDHAHRKELHEHILRNHPEKAEWGTLEYLQDQLEKLVDDYGLQDVIAELSTVCQLKAQHLNVEWQDYAGGVLWTYYADRINDLDYFLFQKAPT